MTGKRINPVAEVRGVIDVFNRWQGRQELALRAALNQQRLKHCHLVGFYVDRFRQLAQLFGEVVNRQRRADGGCTAATTVGRGAWQFLRLQAGNFGQLFAQTIEAQHVRLHFAQLDGEAIDVVLYLLLALFGLGVLIGQQHAANQRMVAGGRVFERQVIGKRGGQTERNQQRHRQAERLRDANGQAFLGSKVARNNDNLHVKFLKSVGSRQALYPRPLGLTQFLDRMPALGAALLHAREGSRQFDVLIEAVPERLKRFVVMASASGTTLSLTVDSPEAAHLARLLSMEMLTNLSRKRLKFNEISVRTQSNNASARRARVLPDATDKRQMSATADKMQSERLQTSLKRLAKTVAER